MKQTEYRRPQRGFGSSPGNPPVPTSVRRGSRIALIGAGGTAGSTKDEYEHYKASAQGEQVLKHILSLRPGLAADFDIKLKHTWSLLSEDLHPSDWGAIAFAIARAINEPQNRPHGIVVTHGTDTLAFTASAITFMFDTLPVPVVFTGSLFPPDFEQSDAPDNVQDSILVAANADYAGVFVVFQGPGGATRRITLANQTLSIAAYGKAFSALDDNYSGRVRDGHVTFSAAMRSRLPRRQDRPVSVSPRVELDDRVRVIKVHPGFRPSDLVRTAENDCRAIILQLYHSGTACTRDVARQSLSLVPAIAKCRDLNVLVFGLPLNHVESGHVYQSTRMLMDAGLEPLPRMSVEAAYVKLIWLLGQRAELTNVLQQMRMNLRGEVAETSPRFDK
ncbi:MAG: asparaginase [Gammaproteobacteria bacterium]